MFLDQGFGKILRGLLAQPRSNETIGLTKAFNEAKILIESEKNSFKFEIECSR